ncbi:MAG TPA: hypothetical protein VIK55_13460 [Paludibacter sp.]
MIAKNLKQQTIEKIKFEISESINMVIKLAKVGGLGDLLYFAHYLHCSRLVKVAGEVPEDRKDISDLYVRQLTDAYKYIIQLLFKHSSNEFLKNKIDNSLINVAIVNGLTELVLGINSKYEALSFLTIFEKMELLGERNQFIKIDLETVTKDDRLSKFLNYGERADRENYSVNETVRRKDDFLKHFTDEYEPYKDLFELEFEITLKDFVELIDFILDKIQSQIKNSLENVVFFENGRVDINAYKTIMNIGIALFLSKKMLFDKFGKNIKKIIEKLTFKKQEFDEQQLQYNLISRKPLLDFGDDFLISPELLLDSLFVNSHYSLLEAGNIKDVYKKRYSSLFLDKISKIAFKYGYIELTRELELYDGKKQIGDIDLVLKSSGNHILLVEAKNHNIPLDVYFHDFEATEKRLEYLRKEWETKVDRRFKHLQKNLPKYGLPETFSYIVISKSPEILSHFSKYLVLTPKEFEFWLNKNDVTLTFQGLHEEFNKINEKTYTMEQLQKMQTDLKTGWKFEME